MTLKLNKINSILKDFDTQMNFNWTLLKVFQILGCFIMEIGQLI